jgi:uncharacterized membrane protein YraQ (UPF0718 family)
MNQHLGEKDKRSFALVSLVVVLWLILYNQVQNIADWLSFGLLGLSRESRWGLALNFFFYDVPKILLLLAGMIFVIGLLQSFIHAEQVRAIVEKRGEGYGNLLGAILGAMTPFCSCSSVPLFIAFVQAGIPLGITFSFLISSPLVSEVAFVMLFGLFGWEIALLYLLSGMLIGLVAGLILGRMKLEAYVEPFVYAIQAKAGQKVQIPKERSWTERFQDAIDNTREIISKIWLYVIFGIAVGAFIHGFVPEDALVEIMGEGAWWAVPVSVLIGTPLYANPAGIMPIVSALLSKGAAIGTVLAFMMSVIALSLPELIILRRVLKPRLIAIFVAIVAVSIVFTGYLFNFLL